MSPVPHHTKVFGDPQSQKDGEEERRVKMTTLSVTRATDEEESYPIVIFKVCLCLLLNMSYIQPNFRETKS